MPRITNHLKPLQALATPGPTVALLLLARTRRTAMTSDKVPQRAKMPPPAQCHPQCPRAALWNILRSPAWAHGRDLGLGGHCSHPNTGFFNPALPSLLLFPVLLGTNLGNTGSPQKNLAHRFFASILDKPALSWPRGSSWAAQAGGSPGRGAQSPSRKLALSTAAGGTRWNSRSHTHSLPSFYLYTQ